MLGRRGCCCPLFEDSLYGGRELSEGRNQNLVVTGDEMSLALVLSRVWCSVSPYFPDAALLVLQWLVVGLAEKE